MNGHGAHQCTLQPIGDAQRLDATVPRRGLRHGQTPLHEEPLIRGGHPSAVVTRQNQEDTVPDRSRRDGALQGAGSSRVTTRYRGPEGRERAA